MKTTPLCIPDAKHQLHQFHQHAGKALHNVSKIIFYPENNYTSQ